MSSKLLIVLFGYIYFLYFINSLTENTLHVVTLQHFLLNRLLYKSRKRLLNRYPYDIKNYITNIFYFYELFQCGSRCLYIIGIYRYFLFIYFIAKFFFNA